MNKIKLLDSDHGESDRECTSKDFTINQNYAMRYDNWRRLEELQKMKDKYGNSTDDSSTSEEEPEWSAGHEMRFLRTLNALKGKDESIYEEHSTFWSDLPQETASHARPKKHDKKKKMYLKDYERKLVLEKGGQIDESTDEDDEKKANYFEQQEQIRNELRRIASCHEDHSGSDTGEILVPKLRTAEERKVEDDDFYEWLKSQDVQHISDNDALKDLKKAWKNPNIDDDEKFLRDYLLNNDFIPEEENREITTNDIEEIEEDDKILDMQGSFEHKYNFRFEDPDQEFIKQYPRTVGESLRKPSTKRKEKRQEYKERKEQEKKEKRMAIRELKNMKRAEIEKKLERLKRIAGDEIAINVDDLTGDFDPREYDMRMQQLFNDDYYGRDGSACSNVAQKPLFSDIDESDSSDYDNYATEPHKDSSSGNNGTPDNDENAGNVITKKEAGVFRANNSQSHRRQKRNRNFREAVRKKKPLFNPDEKTFEEYFNEYYALDYEDIIGDHLTRFKYRQVVPNDFGLSVEEILSADDRQLNAWVSLKKATGYRTEHEEMVEVKRYKKKALDIKKKLRIFTTDFGSKKKEKLKQESATQETLLSLCEGTKKRMEKKHGIPLDKVSQEDGTAMARDEVKKKRRRRKRKTQLSGSSQESSSKASADIAKQRRTYNDIARKISTAEEVCLDDHRLRAYGLNPKKFKSKLKYGKKRLELN